MTTENRADRKTREGIVISDKMDKTITVEESNRVKHGMYGKFITFSKKFHAHDETNDCNQGDTVRIMEVRPLSKTKNWRVIEIIERAKEIKDATDRIKAPRCGQYRRQRSFGDSRTGRYSPSLRFGG